MGSFQRDAVLVSAIAVATIAGANLAAEAQQPPKAGCRVVSKLEYSTAKNENVIISKGGRYVRTGPFWRRNYWHCPV